MRIQDRSSVSTVNGHLPEFVYFKKFNDVILFLLLLSHLSPLKGRHSVVKGSLVGRLCCRLCCRNTLLAAARQGIIFLEELFSGNLAFQGAGPQQASEGKIP